MTAVADVAFGSAWPRAAPPRWMTVLAAAALAVFGVLSAVYQFAGADTYRDLMRGTDTVTLRTEGGLTAHLDLGSTASTVHEPTVAYLLGRAPELPLAPDGTHFFDAAERAHMADVKSVFRGVDIAWWVSGLVFGALVIRAKRSGYLAVLARDAALFAGLGVLAVALIAAIAFVPAFLLFHQVFFPQGNYLFGPDSDLLRVYPEHYWYGVTLRMFGGFCLASLVLAGALTLWLRSSRSVNARSAIVTPR
jgi:hypothetical protein